MVWPFVVVGCLFLALMVYVIKLHRDFVRIQKAASVALEELEGDFCAR